MRSFARFTHRTQPPVFRERRTFSTDAAESLKHHSSRKVVIGTEPQRGQCANACALPNALSALNTNRAPASRASLLGDIIHDFMQHVGKRVFPLCAVNQQAGVEHRRRHAADAFLLPGLFL